MIQSDNPPISEVSPDDAYQELMQDPSARLVDVRTKAEWAYVGLADLSSTQPKEPVLIEWQVFPSMTVADDFGQALQSACPDPSTALYFICRSGARSLAAARLYVRSRLREVFQRHRWLRRAAGWRRAPWYCRRVESIRSSLATELTIKTHA